MLLAMNTFLYITLLPQKIQLKIFLLQIQILYWTTTLLLPMTKTMLTWHMLPQALLQWKEVSTMTAQMKNQGQMPKRCLLLAPRLVSGQTQLCQKRGEEETCQGSPPSLPPLNQGNRGPMGDLYLLFALQFFSSGGGGGGGGCPRVEVLITIIKSPHHHQNRNSKKVMWKQQLLQNHEYGSQLHNPVEL